MKKSGTVPNARKGTIGSKRISLRRISLRSRRLEVVDERENGRARGRPAGGEGEGNKTDQNKKST